MVPVTCDLEGIVKPHSAFSVQRIVWYCCWHIGAVEPGRRRQPTVAAALLYDTEGKTPV